MHACCIKQRVRFEGVEVAVESILPQLLRRSHEKRSPMVGCNIHAVELAAVSQGDDGGRGLQLNWPSGATTCRLVEKSKGLAAQIAAREDGQSGRRQ